MTGICQCSKVVQCQSTQLELAEEEERNRKLGPFHSIFVEHYYILFYDKILLYVIENANGLEIVLFGTFLVCMGRTEHKLKF